MITGSFLIIIILALLLFSFIGLFNKRIGDIINVIFFYLRNLRPSRKNFLKLPITVKKFYSVLRWRRGLLLKKLFARYQHHHARKKEELRLKKPAP